MRGWEGRMVRIGVFDSGIGGLTVLAACRRLLPAVRFYYWGDNGHAPYGSRPREEIASLALRAMGRFARLGVDGAVIACNTVTAVCIGQLRAACKFPVIGMEPAVRPAALACKHVLVLATPRTAESGRLQALIARCRGCNFEVCALPHLAGAIEGALTRGERLTLSDHLPRGSYDGVVLGCTHYAFFREEIARFYGCKVFDGGEGAARRLKNVLKLGMDDHAQPPQTTINPNICFNQNCKERGLGGVIFLGKSRKINESVYKTNICFRKI